MKKNTKVTKEQAEQKIKELKKEIKKTDIFLVCILMFLLIFVCAMIYLTFSTGVEASTLIVSVFGFCGFECGFMSSITKKKIAAKNEIDKLQYKKETEDKKPSFSVKSPDKNVKNDSHDSSDSKDDHDEDIDDNLFQSPIIY